MTYLYYDCFAGLSGDMNLGALVDLGVDLAYIKQELSKLGVDHEFNITHRKADKHGIFGTKVDVVDYAAQPHHNHHTHTHHTQAHHTHAHHEHHSHDHTHGRTFADIRHLIQHSALSERVKRDSLGMFSLIAAAEAKVHDMPIDDVHFHEVGAIDSIVDIVGTAIAMAYLDVDAIVCDTIELGSGFIQCAHGKMPVPAPATAEIIMGMLTSQNVKGYEMTTPTGAAILKYYRKDGLIYDSTKADRIGYGLGTRDLDIPNLVRVTLCKDAVDIRATQQHLIESNIDDMSAEKYDYLESLLFENGARDVFKTPIVMKKGRMATKLSILSDDAHLHACLHVLFKHSTTIGVRVVPVNKIALDREVVDVMTRRGKARIKLSYFNGACINIKPEYDDVLALAKRAQLTLQEAEDMIMAAYHVAKRT